MAVDRGAQQVVYGFASIYALLFIGAAVAVYLAFLQSRFDLGDMTQAVWATAHGDFLRISDPAGQAMSRLGAHADPFLVLFVPLWWIWPSPLVLLIVQAVAVASGALPVFWLARKHLGDSRAAAHFAVGYLIYPATQFNAFTVAAGPHAVSFAVPLILFAIWFLDQERLVPFAVCAVLAASTKEEIPVAVGCLGIWFAWREGRRLTGFAIFLIGLALTLADFLVIIPHYAPHGSTLFAERYADVGGTPTGIATKVLTDPAAIASTVLTWHKLAFILLLLVPFVGLFFLEPLLLLGAVPDLVINLLSSKAEQTSITYQYTGGIIPFLVAASVLGTARLKRRQTGASLAALMGAAALAVYSPIWVAIVELPKASSANSAHIAQAEALKLIPPTASVSASNHLGGYLSDRKNIALFPNLGSATWVIADTNDPVVGGKKRYENDLLQLARSGSWKVVYKQRGVEVLERIR